MQVFPNLRVSNYHINQEVIVSLGFQKMEIQKLEIIVKFFQFQTSSCQLHILPCLDFMQFQRLWFRAKT